MQRPFDSSRACALRAHSGAQRFLYCAFLLANGLAHAAISTPERTALMDLYGTTDGANWLDSTGWGGPSGTECAWHGVVCDAGQTAVIEIRLGHNNLVGTLPTNLDAFPNLQLFFAGNNLLVGGVPTLGGVPNLQNFALGSNQLTGSLPPIDGLTQLDYFDVGNNMLTGTIPSLAGLGLLRRLDLSNNQLSGTIPSLDSLVDLQTLLLNHNQLTGGMPSLAALVNLKNLYVKDNMLEGPPPTPSSPSALVPGGSGLCPNAFDHLPSVDWDVATGISPWYQNCPIDVIFADGFEAP